MKNTLLIISVIITYFACDNRLFAQNLSNFSFNEWHHIVVPETMAETGLHKGKYIYRVPVQLKKGGKYTLLAKWDDGKSRTIQITGYHPEKNSPSKRVSETISAFSINVGGNNIQDTKVFKRNFTISSDSESDIAYLTYYNKTPGQSVNIMIKSPAETDESVLEIVNGKKRGQVLKMPLFINYNKQQTSENNGFIFNQWHHIVIPEIMAETGLHKGKYIYRVPVQLKKGGKYTLLAKWDDGKSRTIQITGYHPEKNSPSKRVSETISAFSINVGGNNIQDTKVFKRNFTISSDSESDIAYLTYYNKTPGQSVNIMIKSPAETDESVLEIVNGKKRGQVLKMPLFITK